MPIAYCPCSFEHLKVLEVVPHPQNIIHINNDMNINIHIDINMNIDITSPPTPCSPPRPLCGRPQHGVGVGWGDINIHIDINMNIDIHIIINMNNILGDGGPLPGP